MKYSTCHELGTKKNLSPQQESNPWPPEHWAGALSTDELRELMESKVILLSFTEFMINSTVLIWAVCRTPVTFDSEKWPYSPWVLVAQWIERPPCVREVMGSILVGDSDFSLSHARVMLNISYFTFKYRAQNSPSSFTYQKTMTFGRRWR